jgi:hypothetical protein
MINVFIDESGTLPDQNDRFIVICGVAVKQLKEAENIFSRISTSLKILKTKYYNRKNNKLAGNKEKN